MASLDAMKLFTILFCSKSTQRIILSQEAVKSMLYSFESMAHEMGSANLNTAWQTPVAWSHYRTVQSFDVVMMYYVSVAKMALILLV